MKIWKNLELQCGFDENGGDRENGIVVNKTEKGYCVTITGERGVISEKRLFDTSNEAYHYVIDSLRYRKRVIVDTRKLFKNSNEEKDEEER